MQENMFSVIELPNIDRLPIMRPEFLAWGKKVVVEMSLYFRIQDGNVILCEQYWICLSKHAAVFKFAVDGSRRSALF